MEEAGKDFVGVCLDSGNPLWTIEDPHLTLETLHPYVLTSHIRDTAVWRVPEGAAVQWVRMGDGNIGIDDYVRKYTELCPGRALSLEIIVTQPRIFPISTRSSGTLPHHARLGIQPFSDACRKRQAPAAGAAVAQRNRRAARARGFGSQHAVHEEATIIYDRPFSKDKVAIVTGASRGIGKAIAADVFAGGRDAS